MVRDNFRLLANTFSKWYDTKWNYYLEVDSHANTFTLYTRQEKKKNKKD